MTRAPSSDAPPDAADLPSLLAETQAALQASRDREAELRRELEHRVRNALAVTRSVVSRTMGTASSVDHARDHLSGRLDALARYHGRLAATPGSTFDLESMIWDELLVVASANDPRIAVSGPFVRLDPQVAEVIGLALHELATNSVKFGVLGDPSASGRLRIEWQDQKGEVRLDWHESGVPIVAQAPIMVGFGQDYIEQAIPYQLGGETRFTLVPGGVVCSMRFAAEKAGMMDRSDRLSR